MFGDVLSWWGTGLLNERTQLMGHVTHREKNSQHLQGPRLVWNTQPVFKSITSQRVIYAASASSGTSVYESRDEKAKLEIQSIVEELTQWVN